MRIALSIAGSDSGGGAGIQADLKTFMRFGVYGTSVITAVTAQNTVGVRAWSAVQTPLVRDQIDAVAEDLRPHAIKSGMLADAAIVETVAAGIRAHALQPYVLDPVMVATSGDVLLEPDAVAAIRTALIPLATIVTPNLDEAALLLGQPVSNVAEMEHAARWFVDTLGAHSALVKGGHLKSAVLVDVFYDGQALRHYSHPRIETRSTHGTGCTLSAAITALLASGSALPDAVPAALDWVHRAIGSAPGLGSGNGPLNHLAALNDE